jgi:hypothetical protein
MSIHVKSTGAIKVFALLMIAGICEAAPPCWPSLSNPPLIGNVPANVSGSLQWWAGWKCPDGSTSVYLLDYAEVAAYIVKVRSGTFSQVEADADCAIHCQPVDTVQHQFIRTTLVDKFGFPAISLDGIAYKQRLGVDTTQYVAIGKVVSGTQCPNAGYAVVPRAAVTLNSKYDTLPLVVYARCG